MTRDGAPHAATVLVTGVGAIIGQGIVRSLRACGRPVHVLGMDRSDRSPGPRWCDEFVLKPACTEGDPRYLAFWLGLARDRRIDLVIPGLEVDVDFLDRHRDALSDAGLRLMLDRPDLLALCRDKWMLGAALPEAGLAPIPAVLPTTMAEGVAALGPPPLLLKPRRGSGSRGIVLLHDERDFAYWVPRTPEPMLQRIVGGDADEYTVGVFGFGDGSALDPIIFRRRLSAAGNTCEAERVDDSAISDACLRLNGWLRPSGPVNYQFRKQGETPWLLEVNPRFSSSNSLRTAFGFNEAGMCLDWFLDRRRPAPPRLANGIAWRYTEDYLAHARDPV